jgi:citrate synthase
LSDVDGEYGRLVIRGRDVESLAGHVTFEEAVARLWTGEPRTHEAIRAELGRARVAAFERIAALRHALSLRDGMDALRATLAQLEATGDPHADGIALVASAAVFAAAWARANVGAALIAPDPSLGHATDYLRMATGQPRNDDLEHALEAYLVTVTEHGMNASTFTARVVASTGSDLVSAIVAAVGALKGPLHGGAPGPVLDMLDAIGAPERAEAWLERELLDGRRIMGMGHRIYRTRDPRAAVLERAIERMEHGRSVMGRLPLARAVERAAEGALRARHPERPLHANVEFYTAVLLEAVGLPRSAFSITFAAARTVGWIAHVQEQRTAGRLIRPASRYTGAMPEQ